MFSRRSGFWSKCRRKKGEGNTLTSYPAFFTNTVNLHAISKVQVDLDLASNAKGNKKSFYE